MTEANDPLQESLWACEKHNRAVSNIAAFFIVHSLIQYAQPISDPRSPFRGSHVKPIPLTACLSSLWFYRVQWMIDRIRFFPFRKKLHENPIR